MIGDRKFRFIRVYEKDYQDMLVAKDMFVKSFPQFDSARLTNCFMFRKLLDHWFGKI